MRKAPHSTSKASPQQPEEPGLQFVIDTHTHPCPPTNPHTHRKTHTHTNMHARTHTHTHTHTHTRNATSRHFHAKPRHATQTRRHADTQTHTDTDAHTNTHSFSLSQSRRGRIRSCACKFGAAAPLAAAVAPHPPWPANWDGPNCVEQARALQAHSEGVTAVLANATWPSWGQVLLLRGDRALEHSVLQGFVRSHEEFLVGPATRHS